MRLSDIPEYIEHARAHVQGDLPRARACLLKCLEIIQAEEGAATSEQSPVLWALGRIEAEMGNPQDGTQRYLQAEQLSPEWPFSKLATARHLADQGELQAAQAKLDEAVGQLEELAWHDGSSGLTPEGYRSRVEEISNSIKSKSSRNQL